MRITRIVRAFVVGLGLLLIGSAGCGDDPVANDAPITLDVFFSLTVDGTALQLNSPIYTNPAGTVYSIKTLRFILSDIRLQTDAGKSVLVKGVHYFDIADASTQTIHATNLVHANYTGVTFTFGLNAANNVRDKYKSSIPAIMEWPTGLGPNLGYHYLQLEGNFEQSPGGPTAGYTTHTGARQLDGTNPDFPLVVDQDPHHFFFTISAPFTPQHIHEGGHGELDINFNLNGWYMDHTPVDGNDTQYDFKTLPSQTIMGDLDAQGKLQSNGPGCFSAELTAHGGHDH